MGRRIFGLFMAILAPIPLNFALFPYSFSNKIIQCSIHML